MTLLWSAPSPPAAAGQAWCGQPHRPSHRRSFDRGNLRRHPRISLSGYTTKRSRPWPLCQHGWDTRHSRTRLGPRGGTYLAGTRIKHQQGQPDEAKELYPNATPEVFRGTILLPGLRIAPVASQTAQSVSKYLRSGRRFSEGFAMNEPIPVFLNEPR